MNETIKIMQIGRKQMPSQFKQGETYAMTTVMDEKNRELVAMGNWAENWKQGDEIEVIVEEKEWTNPKTGFKQTNFKLVNPNKKPFTPGFGRGNAKADPITQSFELAAKIAPLLYAEGKKLKLDDIADLAKAIREKIASVSPTTTLTETKVPEIDVKKEENTDTKPIDDDEKPF